MQLLASYLKSKSTFAARRPRVTAHAGRHRPRSRGSLLMQPHNTGVGVAAVRWLSGVVVEVELYVDDLV